MTIEEIDCISREQAKAFIRDKFKDLPSRVEINTILNELPSVTLQESKWIPCSERLPKRNGYYLVTGRQGAVNKRLYQDGHWYGNWAILAWMPLPEPYVTEINVGKKAESEVK